MRKGKKPYVHPQTEVVLYAPLLNGNSYKDDGTGLVGFGSGPKDAGLGQAKETFSRSEECGVRSEEGEERSDWVSGYRTPWED